VGVPPLPDTPLEFRPGNGSTSSDKDDGDDPWEPDIHTDTPDCRRQIRGGIKH